MYSGDQSTHNSPAVVYALISCSNWLLCIYIYYNGLDIHRIVIYMFYNGLDMHRIVIYMSYNGLDTHRILLYI